MRQPRVLVSWYTRPDYIAPFILSDRQVTLVRKQVPDGAGPRYDGWTPQGAYDLYDIVKRQNIDPSFDLDVVVADASQVNRPFNTRAFGATTLLCVGDTHHMSAPLQNLTKYAVSESFDFVASLYNRHHLHWFVAAGCSNVGWFPGLPVLQYPGPFLAARTPQIAFVGQSGRHHPRRVRYLGALRASGMPLLASSHSQQEALALYGASLASFNCSLNGDLNLRVFEVAERGEIIEDPRLDPVSGFEVLSRHRELCIPGGSISS